VNLFFYSGGSDNDELDQLLLACARKTNPVIGYIPSEDDVGADEFEDFCDHFRSYGCQEFRYLNPDQIGDFFRSDIIFMGGGNTFDFLHWMRGSHVERLLRKYAEAGGVIAGESAGAILMTPSIHTASFPVFDCDANDIQLQDFRSLGLVPFEFFPHYEHRRAYINEFLDYTRTTKTPLFAATDGSGIVVDAVSTRFVGDVWAYFSGHVFKINGD
jgi:dipeptidase E